MLASRNTVTILGILIVASCLAGRSLSRQSACAPMSYCPPQVNSMGCPTRMTATGCSSASSSSGFLIGASRLIPGNTAFLLYDVTGLVTAKQFLGGALCVHQPIFRSIPLVVQGDPKKICDGAAIIDMNAFAAGALGGLPFPTLSTPGTPVACQFWSRDPGFAAGSNLTNAMRYVVGF